MSTRLVHGLIQKAKRDAENAPYKIYPGGEGFRLWRLTSTGWTIIGTLKHRQDAEDLILAKLPQPE